MVALTFRAVEAVNFIRWLPSQRHIGVDADGTGACTLLFEWARPHHPLPALAAGAGAALLYRLMWSQSCAHELAMSWWKHLDHQRGMLEPPSVVLTDRALDILWLRHTSSGTLG